jgi:sigma-B regulation protein RsbU (phosphoserine phosphatase)
MSAAVPRVLFCTDNSARVGEVRAHLEHAGFVSGFAGFAEPDRTELNGWHLAVIDAAVNVPAALEFCRRLRNRLTDTFVPLLVLADEPLATVRLAAFDHGADAVLSQPFAPRELVTQILALLRVKESHDRSAEKTAEVSRINKRLQAAHQQIDQELDLARRLQQSFLPQALPQVPRLRFAVQYLLCGRVGGDFYDVFRLDEHHVGFYVADAMGHGVPASLLTIFVKRGVRAKEIFGSQYRLVPPAEVLDRLNRDLVELALSEHPFITMVYALLDFRDGTLRFARAGHPHPLLVPRSGEPRLLEVRGSLLGVFETDFPELSVRLRPGDKLVIYSDGIDNVSYEGHAPGAASLLACAARHRSLAVPDLIEVFRRDLAGSLEQADDLTLLGLEICPT